MPTSKCSCKGCSVPPEGPNRFRSEGKGGCSTHKHCRICALLTLNWLIQLISLMYKYKAVANHYPSIIHHYKSTFFLLPFHLSFESSKTLLFADLQTGLKSGCLLIVILQVLKHLQYELEMMIAHELAQKNPSVNSFPSVSPPQQAQQGSGCCRKQQGKGGKCLHQCCRQRFQIQWDLRIVPSVFRAQCMHRHRDQLRP